jgi:hypothetical protein
MFEIASRFVFLDALPADLQGKTANVSFVLTSLDDPATAAQIDQTVLLQLQQ